MGGNNKKHTMTGTKSKNPTSEQISLLSSDDEDIVYTTVLSAPQHGRRSKYKNLYQLSPHSDIEKNLAATEQHRPSQYGSPHLDEYEVEDETRSPYSCGCSWWLVVLLVVLVLAVLASATVLIYYEVVRDRQDEDQSQLPPPVHHPVDDWQYYRTD